MQLPARPAPRAGAAVLPAPPRRTAAGLILLTACATFLMVGAYAILSALG